jgi:hypothetical protein
MYFEKNGTFEPDENEPADEPVQQHSAESWECRRQQVAKRRANLRAALKQRGEQTETELRFCEKEWEGPAPELSRPIKEHAPIDGDLRVFAEWAAEYGSDFPSRDEDKQ